MHAIRESITQRTKQAGRRLAWPYRQVTSRHRALPHFIIVGAQKAGTTSLFYYLSQHPRVHAGVTKEVHFFDGGTDPAVDTYARGVEWYRCHFPLESSLGESGLTGEASPLYLFNPLAAGRIHKIVPETKLIAVLRNPVDRAISHYFHERNRGREPLGLFEALHAEDERIRPALECDRYKDFAFIHYSYKNRGCYHLQLKRYFSYFPRQQLLLLSAEELFADPQTSLGKVFNFLEIEDRCGDFDLLPKNIARRREDVDARTYEYLACYFSSHNKALYDMIGVDFGW